MQMVLGGFTPGESVAARVSASGKVRVVRRRSQAGSVRQAERAPAERAQPEQPPRVGAGPSEIVMLDPEGRIVAVNQAWRAAVAAYGFDLPDAGIGGLYVDAACRFLPDLDRAGLELSLRRLLNGDDSEIRHTYAIATARGPRWRQLQITPLSIETGGRFVAIHDDQTDLALAQEALQTTSEQLLTARDDERERIALELHDSTSQHLAAASLGLAALKRVSSPTAREAALIEDIGKSLSDAIRETRVISYLMKPRGLARNGLSATVRQFLEGFAQRTGLKVTLEADPAVDRAPAPLQHAALRIVQEALLNAHRHAQPRRVAVELAVRDREMTVSVADDGRGIPPSADEPRLGVGIPGMRARARQFGGRLAILSDKRGTRVLATLPLS